MPVLGVTGGVGTGKSTFVRALLQYIPAELFDADKCAGELLEADDAVRESVRRTFGSAVFGASGVPDRVRLRELVFADEGKRKQLEAILHPAIRARWTAAAGEHASGGGWFCVDIPLLFETNAQSYFDRVIVVACSPATQRTRLREIRGLSDEIVARMIAAQLELGSKVAKADHLIWNESSLTNLQAQADLLARSLRQRYGSIT